MTQPKIWHNPSCSKSRQTLALLEERGFTPEIVNYQQTPPTEAAIRTALELLRVEAIALMRTGEQVFKDLGLSKNNLPETLIAAMVTHPILIERPLVWHNGKASLGRPPESVLDIL
ncbi:MAG: arsenate reductase (glutaredoxin) [Rhodobacteraceae bacterium]|nr:arsenate reductase (glutaredoxin) [Paracoccaceae bacterium]